MISLVLSFVFITNLYSSDYILPEIFVSFSNTRYENCPKYKNINDLEISDFKRTLKGVDETEWNVFKKIDDDLDRKSIIEAIEKNIHYLSQKDTPYKFIIGKKQITKDKLLETNKRLYEIFSSTLTYAGILKILKNEFSIYRAYSDDTGKVVITGYYESEIEVKSEKDNEYRYPLHYRPPDLVKTPDGYEFDYGRYDENGNLVKYYSTSEIRGGKIDNYHLEIAYSNHPSHIMLAQIQGSSILRFPDGSYVRVGFDGANGWKYVSVQRILMECGEIPSMNFKSFIKYLSSQPREREEKLVNLNPRYIFFRLRYTGPVGATGETLIPHRSVAIDPKYIPYGMIGYIISKRPVADEKGENIVDFKNFSRFIATHDTGSAIRGAGRIDLFWGNGKKAELESSSMKEYGEFYLFLIK